MAILERVPNDVWVALLEHLAYNSPESLLPLSRTSSGLHAIFRANERRLLRVGLLSRTLNLDNFESALMLAQKDFYPSSYPSDPNQAPSNPPLDLFLLRNAFKDSLTIHRFARFLNAKRRVFLQMRNPAIHHTLRLYHVPEIPFNSTDVAPSLAEWIANIHEFALVPPYRCKDDTLPDTLRVVLDWFLLMRRGRFRIGAMTDAATGINLLADNGRSWNMRMRDWRFVAECHYADVENEDILENWEAEAERERGAHWNQGAADEYSDKRQEDWERVEWLYQEWENDYFNNVLNESQNILQRHARERVKSSPQKSRARPTKEERTRDISIREVDARSNYPRFRGRYCFALQLL